MTTTVSYADIIEIEMALRPIMRSKGQYLVIQPCTNKNTEFDNPVRVTINSNTFYVDREDLVDLQDPFTKFDLWDTFMDWMREQTKGK